MLSMFLRGMIMNSVGNLASEYDVHGTDTGTFFDPDNAKETAIQVVVSLISAQQFSYEKFTLLFKLGALEPRLYDNFCKQRQTLLDNKDAAIEFAEELIKTVVGSRLSFKNN